jgi:nitrate ABC transporter ATP-binding subunit
MKKYLDIWKLGKAYRTPDGLGTAVIVEDFDLAVASGEFVSIIGHSGCGKSTVLSMVAGLADSSAGAIILDNKEVKDPGPDRAMVFQSPCLFHWMTAFDNVLLGVEQVFEAKKARERAEIVEHYLSLVGLADSMHKKPGELSQGMQQRVGLARAFALSPKLLLLDEPFGMLDSLTRFELQEILLDILLENRTTVLMVTHDVDEALFLSDRIVLMTSGPAATVGSIVEVPFERPRMRREVLDDARYYTERERLIGFLADQASPSEDVAPEEDATVGSRLEALKPASL